MSIMQNLLIFKIHRLAFGCFLCIYRKRRKHQNQTEKSTEISIADIDKITELFLKQKADYSLLDERNILKDIAFIYLLELYENKDTITLESLKNSYINDYLKWIVLSIKALKDLDIISQDILLDFNSDITLSNLLEIIKRIQFKEKVDFDIKTLIKKI